MSRWEDITMGLTTTYDRSAPLALATTPLSSILMPARPRPPVADKQAPNFDRYKVGDALVTVISDGVNTFPLGDSSVLDAKKMKSTPCSKKPIAEGQGEHRVRAAGDQTAASCRPSTPARSDRVCVEQGQCRTTRHDMAAVGIRSQGRSTRVAISHFHGDHINGLLMPRHPGTPERRACEFRPRMESSWMTAR